MKEKEIIEILEKYHEILYQGHQESDNIYGIDDLSHKKIAKEITELSERQTPREAENNPETKQLIIGDLKR